MPRRALEGQRIENPAAMYMNFDGIGSPNFVRFIMDGDGSTGSNPAPVPGSEVIESFWSDFFTSRGLASEPVQFFSGDHVGFALAGIPYSALFTGTFDIKTAAQAATYGGTAGVQYDPCYQLACDNISNVNLTVLGQNAHAAAAAILHFGTTSELPAREGSTSSAHAGPVMAEAAE